MCESLIDALTFWRHGLRHVTAAFGADGFTDELHTALTEAGVGRVLIAFDRDEAGDRGAAALAERLGDDGVECFRVLFPAGQDANSFATRSRSRPVRSRSSCARRCGSARASRPHGWRRHLSSPSLSWRRSPGAVLGSSPITATLERSSSSRATPRTSRARRTTSRVILPQSPKPPRSVFAAAVVAGAARRRALSRW